MNIQFLQRWILACLFFMVIPSCAQEGATITAEGNARRGSTPAYQAVVADTGATHVRGPWNRLAQGPSTQTQSKVENATPRTDAVFGVLQSTPGRAAELHAAGIHLAEFGLAWQRYEPKPGEFDAKYIVEVKAKIAALRAAGQEVALDFGMQYPPQWIFDLPNSRYRNQYGDEFHDPAPGMNGANAVWNNTIRERQAAYAVRVFADLGTDWHHVRLGWGWYSELNFPKAKFKGKPNCYWAFDEIAQGKAPGLPDGLEPCPVPGWTPGSASEQHRSASLFLDWYLSALDDYHDWQINTIRRHFGGRVAMLYPSWGIRPGQQETAIAVDLDGSTLAEKNGEVSAGLDFARFVSGIRDPQVTVYTTWLDAPFGNDELRDPVQWTPGHYLAFLAAANPLNLRTMGENTGGADIAALERSVRRMREYGLDGLIWAFEPQLFDGKHVTLAQLAEAIRQK